jgi:hypothetical protein
MIGSNPALQKEKEWTVDLTALTCVHVWHSALNSCASLLRVFTSRLYLPYPAATMLAWISASVAFDASPEVITPS